MSRNPRLQRTVSSLWGYLKEISVYPLPKCPGLIYFFYSLTCFLSIPQDFCVQSSLSIIMQMSLGKKMIALYQLIFQGEPQQQMPKTISQEPGYKRGIYKKGREVGGGRMARRWIISKSGDKWQGWVLEIGQGSDSHRAKVHDPQFCFLTYKVSITLSTLHSGFKD